MSVQARRFFLALSFLTRLAPAKAATAEEIAQSFIYLPLVGGLLGIVLALPLKLGLAGGSFWVQAWLYVVFSAWLTRALHLDGLADLIDALGSGKSGEGFQKILKDSRIGAFGVAGLVIALGGQTICVAACLGKGLWPVLVYAPLFGRSLPILLAAVAEVNPASGLGKLTARAPRKAAVGLSVVLVCLIGPLCAGWAGFCLSLIMGLGLLAFLARIAGRQGGYNGDFLGAAIVGGELAVLLGALL